MSLRDFNSPSDDPIALHNSPQGNGGGLGNFHTTNPEDREPNNTPKIGGADDRCCRRGPVRLFGFVVQQADGDRQCDAGAGRAARSGGAACP